MKSFVPLIIVVLCALPIIRAEAQSGPAAVAAASAASPTIAAPPAAFHIMMSTDELNLVGRALGKLPLEESLGTWNDIQQQVIDQANAGKTPAADRPHAKFDDVPAAAKPETK